MIHSHHGSPSTFWAFSQRAKDSRLLASMSTIGDADADAVIESFWARMQTELLDRRRWRTRVELANAISLRTWRSSTIGSDATAPRARAPC